jgi:hypothetical protein
MKAFLGALTCALALLALPAAADHERGAAYRFRPQFQAQPGPPGQFKGDPRRDPRGDRQVDRRGAGERPAGRLTDEERRELRRDLDKANRELYRRRQERR